MPYSHATCYPHRFLEHPSIGKFGALQFYVSAPLIASNGHYLGSFCMLDPMPRPNFDADQCATINNLANLAATHLEKYSKVGRKQRKMVSCSLVSQLGMVPPLLCLLDPWH